MEKRGVTRSIHPELKPLLENLKDPKGSLLSVMKKYKGAPDYFDMLAASDANPTIYYSHRSGLLDAVYHAYYDHLPLVLSADIIWLAIMQGVSFHVSANKDTLRDKLVSFKGEKSLVVVIDDWFNSNKNWHKAFKMMNNMIFDSINPKAAQFIGSNFSTATPITRAAINIATMDCFKHFFEYRIIVGCGIPQVTLEGTLEDWKQLRLKTKGLLEYLEMDFWLPVLLPVLEEFEYFYSHGVNVKFWDCIYKPMPAAISGGFEWKEISRDYHAGWIINFFPYTAESRKVRLKEPLNSGIVRMPNTGMKTLEQLYAIHDMYLDKLNTNTSQNEFNEYFEALGNVIVDRFMPGGVSEVPFKFTNLAKDKFFEAIACAGFFGYSVDPKTFFVKPVVGWFVGENKKKSLL